jgi:Mn-dependent DtxR family transcriptional regulator
MLLSTFDRVDAEEVPFTQDSLAFLLGVRRASVGDVMVELKKAKLLRYARGRIVLLDRAGLESAACECYRHIRAASSGVFGPEGS